MYVCLVPKFYAKDTRIQVISHLVEYGSDMGRNYELTWKNARRNAGGVMTPYIRPRCSFQSAPPYAPPPVSMRRYNRIPHIGQQALLPIFTRRHGAIPALIAFGCLKLLRPRMVPASRFRRKGHQHWVGSIPRWDPRWRRRSHPHM